MCEWGPGFLVVFPRPPPTPLHTITTPRTHLELAQGLEEDVGLDVADGAPDLDEADVGRLPVSRAAVHDLVRDAVQPVLDRVRHVRDHLHSLAEVVAAPLGVDHLRVHLASRQVVVAGQGHVEEALVVAQVEVGLWVGCGEEGGGRSEKWAPFILRDGGRPRGRTALAAAGAACQHCLRALRRAGHAESAPVPRTAARATARPPPNDQPLPPAPPLTSPPSLSTKTSPCSNGLMVPASLFCVS